MSANLRVVSCSLSTDGQRARLREWHALLAAADSRQDLPSGVRFRFHPRLARHVRSLAAAEEECCSFLRFEVTDVADGVVMTVEGDGEIGLGALRSIFDQAIGARRGRPAAWASGAS